MRKIVCFIALLFSLILPAAERVVALSPNAAEMFLTLQAEELLCGRCSACKAPELSSLPEAGSMGLPSVEMILRLQPTLIVTDALWPSASWATIKKAGIRVLLLPNETLEDYPANLRLLGKILHREVAAERAAAAYESELEGLRRDVPAQKCRVLLLFSLSPVVSCGKKSFLTQAVFLAGGESITASMEGAYFTLSAEVVLARSPEMIVGIGLSQEALQDYFSRPEYHDLSAVKQGNLIAFEENELFCRSGPRLLSDIRRLRKVLQKKNR